VEHIVVAAVASTASQRVELADRLGHPCRPLKHPLAGLLKSSWALLNYKCWQAQIGLNHWAVVVGRDRY